MRNWGQAVITQVVKWLILLLPEDYQAYILDIQNQSDSAGYTNAEIQTEIFKAIIDSYKGLIQTIPGTLVDLWEKLNPNYCSNIYGIYGSQAIEQVETEFIKDHYKINLKAMRISGIALILFYIILGVLDIWCLPETKVTAWLIKLFVCSILFVTTYLAFCPRIFSKYNQQIISVSLTAAALGIISTMSLSRIDELGHHTYYGALTLIIFYIYLISGLRFFNALVVSLILLFGYAAINHISQSTTLDYQLQHLRYFNNNFFLITCLIVGASACNIFERTIRLNFLIRYTISNSFREFLHFFEYENPEKFFDNISRIGSSPQILEKFLLESFAYSQNNNVLPHPENIRFKKQSLLEPKNQLEAELNNTRVKNIRMSRKGYLLSLLLKSLTKVFYIINNLLNQIQDINLTFVKKDYCADYQRTLKKIEELFWFDYFQSSLISIRLASTYAFTFYGLFAIADIFCLPETKIISIPIRLVFCLITIIVFCTSFFEKVFQKFNQTIIIIVALMGGLGITFMIAFSKPTELGYTTYYAGLIHIMFYIFLFARLLFLNAVLVGFLIIFGYGIMAIYFQNLLSSFENTALFMSNILFLIVSCVVGSIACYLFEQNSRLDFLTRYTIAYKSQ